MAILGRGFLYSMQTSLQCKQTSLGLKLDAKGEDHSPLKHWLPNPDP